jgi:hypothetical protein
MSASVSPDRYLGMTVDGLRVQLASPSPER